MSLLTLEATIADGRVVPDEPERLPRTGRALLTILPPAPPAAPPARTLGDALRGLEVRGRYTDLSTNKAHLDDLGR
jgi:hypothetical protein